MIRSIVFTIIGILTSLHIAADESHRIGKESSKLSSNSPSKVVMNFLVWYRDNKNRLEKFELVNNLDETINDTSKYYTLNWNNAESYLAELKMSGLVSELYIDWIRLYFKKCDQHFKANPQHNVNSSTGPYGLNYDFIIWCSGCESKLDSVETRKTSIAEIDGQHVNVKVDFSSGSELKFSVSEYGDKWLIDKIDGWK